MRTTKNYFSGRAVSRGQRSATSWSRRVDRFDRRLRRRPRPACRTLIILSPAARLDRSSMYSLNRSTDRTAGHSRTDPQQIWELPMWLSIRGRLIIPAYCRAALVNMDIMYGNVAYWRIQWVHSQADNMEPILDVEDFEKTFNVAIHDVTCIWPLGAWNGRFSDTTRLNVRPTAVDSS